MEPVPMSLDFAGPSSSRATKAVHFADDLPSLSHKAKRRLDQASGASSSRTRGGRHKRRKENDHFVDHPLSERFGELVDVHDLYPPTHNAVRPGPFASLRTRRDVESLLLVDGLSPADLKEPTKPHGPPAGAPNLSRADRKLHRAIRTMPCMWDWLRAREEEIISFCLDRVHGRWNEVIERTQTDPWAPRDHHTDVSDDSEAESETVYVSTAGGSRAARSRRGSFEVREVPEFLVWGSCSDSFGRLCLHALCRYYSMRSRTLNDETSDMKMILVEDRPAGHGPLPLVKFSDLMTH